jgi:hypothetical protein
MSPVFYRSEDEELQRLLEQNPDLLAGEQINPDEPPRWLRHFATVAELDENKFGLSMGQRHPSRSLQISIFVQRIPLHATATFKFKL